MRKIIAALGITAAIVAIGWENSPPCRAATTSKNKNGVTIVGVMNSYASLKTSRQRSGVLVTVSLGAAAAKVSCNKNGAYVVVGPPVAVQQTLKTLGVEPWALYQ